MLPRRHKETGLSMKGGRETKRNTGNSGRVVLEENGVSLGSRLLIGGNG